MLCAVFTTYTPWWCQDGRPLGNISSAATSREYSRFKLTWYPSTARVKTSMMTSSQMRSISNSCSKPSGSRTTTLSRTSSRCPSNSTTSSACRAGGTALPSRGSPFRWLAPASRALRSKRRKHSMRTAAANDRMPMRSVLKG